jgi:hypothetical protein
MRATLIGDMIITDALLSCMLLCSALQQQSPEEIVEALRVETEAKAKKAKADKAQRKRDAAAKVREDERLATAAAAAAAAEALAKREAQVTQSLLTYILYKLLTITADTSSSIATAVSYSVNHGIY